ALPERPLRRLEELARDRVDLADGHRSCRVAVPAVLPDADVERENVSLAERSLRARDPVHHFLVHRGADARWIVPVSLERRLAARVPNELLGDLVQLERRAPWADLARQRDQAASHDLGALPDPFDLLRRVEPDRRRRDPAALQAFTLPIARSIAAYTFS